MTYPDYTTEVQRKRTSHIKVNQLLCECNITYSLLFSARLRVVDEGKTQIFPSAEDAWTWLLGQSAPRRPSRGSLADQPQLKKTSGIKMRPSKAQLAEGQAKALIEATQLTSNQYAAFRDDKALDSASSLGRSSESTVPATLGPEVTPHIPDDL
ncbi:hypothetical protein NDU88_006233 [Pleurodeles waltl]|uniref:Uncharacterized protein n=1 Tax=Pleurodeles waltl TaxID=8319 RepID=A0AAV7LRW8_PLEWA|nr:hypothetical protein NDU88_006233 [Pleurodeles waltl]